MSKSQGSRAEYALSYSRSFRGVRLVDAKADISRIFEIADRVLSATIAAILSATLKTVRVVSGDAAGRIPVAVGRETRDLKQSSTTRGSS
jgi:hypothetical protein